MDGLQLFDRFEFQDNQFIHDYVHLECNVNLGFYSLIRNLCAFASLREILSGLASLREILRIAVLA
jgi:hypothetical protein